MQTQWKKSFSSLHKLKGDAMRRENFKVIKLSWKKCLRRS